MQLRHSGGLFLLQAGAKQIGEQVVVAPPAAHLIQRHQEQAGLLYLLQQRLATGPAGDGIAQLTAQPIQHRCLQQEGADLLALPLEYFFGQVVQDVAVAAGKRRDEPGHILLPAQRQSGQLQAGRPPLGPGRQRGHRRFGQSQAGPSSGAPQHHGRLGGGEPQLGRAQLSQLTAGSQPRERQRRITSARQHDTNPRRGMLQQERERLMHRLGADHVVVIEDQQRLARVWLRGQFVDQGCHQALERRRRGRPEQPGHPVADPGTRPVQGGHRVPPESGRVVIPGVQGKPRGRVLAAPDPVSEQDCLAVAGRGADQDQPPGQALVEPFGQARTRYQVRPYCGHAELGRQQDIPLPRGYPRWGRGRLNHRSPARSAPPAIRIAFPHFPVMPVRKQPLPARSHSHILVLGATPGLARGRRAPLQRGDRDHPP